jgi:hypothetical protein
MMELASASRPAKERALPDMGALFEEGTTDHAWALFGVLLVAHDEAPNVHRALLTIFEALPQMKLPNGGLATFPEEEHLETLIFQTFPYASPPLQKQGWKKPLQRQAFVRCDKRRIRQRRATQLASISESRETVHPSSE